MNTKKHAFAVAESAWNCFCCLLIMSAFACFFLWSVRVAYSSLYQASHQKDQKEFQAMFGVSLPETPEDTEKIRSEIQKLLSRFHQEMNEPYKAFWEARHQRNSIDGMSPEALSKKMEFQRIMDAKKDENRAAYYRFKDFSDNLERFTGESFQKEIRYVATTAGWVHYYDN